MKKFITILFCLLVSYSISQEKLPHPINTNEYSEFCPTLSADGKTLVFQSDRDGNWRLYESMLLDDTIWSEPKSIEAINNFDNRDIFIGTPFLTYDGNYLYFSSDMKGSYGSLDIFYSKKENGKWGTPINLGANINSKGYEGYPSLTPDGNSIYYAKRKIGETSNEKCFKIFCSTKLGEEEWMTTALSSVINNSCEDAPRILQDGKTLIFSSIRKDGLGKFDVYKSVFLEEAGWAKPENLLFINSEFNDKFFENFPSYEKAIVFNDGGFTEDLYIKTIPMQNRIKKRLIVKGNVVDSESGNPIIAKLSITNVKNNKILTEVYSSETDGSFELNLIENGEVKLVASIDDYIIKETIINISELNEFIVETPIVLNNEEYRRSQKKSIVKGNIIDNETGNPIIAKLSITNVRNNKIITELYSSETDGSFEVELTNVEEYEIYVSAEGYYLPEPIKIDSLFDKNNILKSIALKNISEQTNLVIREIYFDFNSAIIKEESYNKLNQIVELLKNNPSVSVLISAHTDDKGDFDYNMKLSKYRAQSVVKYLINNGVNKDKLESQGFGETMPIDTNDSEEGRANNRRVEFKIIKID